MIAGSFYGQKLVSIFNVVLRHQNFLVSCDLVSNVIKKRSDVWLVNQSQVRDKFFSPNCILL